MRLLLLPLLCLLSTAIASASPQNRPPPPKGQGGSRGPGGPKGPGGPGGPGGQGGDPPIEKYIARITSSLTRLDSGLRTVPPGGSVQDAQRITGNLMKIQDTIVSDLRTGAREIRTWGGPPLPQAYLIANSLVTTGQKLSSVMRGWRSQYDMVSASGTKSELISQLESFAGAQSVFFDDIAAKIGIVNQAAVQSAKALARTDVEGAIEALKR